MVMSRVFGGWGRAAAAAVLSMTAAFAPPASAQSPGDSLRYDRELERLLGQDGFGDSLRAAPYDPAGAAVALPANVDVSAVRRGLDSATRDAGALYDALNAQATYAPAVRPLMADVLKLRARASRLATQMTSVADLTRALPELKQLDGDWRVLSYRLKMVRELDRTATDLVARLDATGDALGRQLQIGQTVDYRALIQHTSALVTALDRLIDDVDYEFGRTAQGADLRIEGQRVRQHAAHMADIAFGQGSYDHLTADFKLYRTAWTPYAGRLRGLNSRTVERAVQQVQQVEREVATQLRLPQTIDREQLLYMTRNLERNVDDFFSRAPLKMLIKLPDADLALATADEFYGVFENFTDVAKRDGSPEAMVDAFRYIDGSWRNFAKVYRPLNSTDAQQVLASIEKDVAALRAGLLIQEAFDRRKAAELAATVENLAGHLDRDVRSWLARDRHPYASDCQREVTAFVNSSRTLHAAIAGGASLADIQRQTDGLFESWRRVYGYIIRCQTSERPYLASTSSQTTPVLVELRTLLSR